MSLARRDRAKINAALVLLHDEGYDVAEVTDVAAIGIRSGTPTQKAYERAFNQFVARVPSLQAPLQRLGQLIDASDNATVARYNVGLAAYIDTGDRAHLDAIAPMAQHDAAEMARRTGDAGFAENLPDAPAATADGERPGHGATGYSPSVAAAPPAAPMPASPPARPGVTPIGYQPGSAREQAASHGEA